MPLAITLRYKQLVMKINTGKQDLLMKDHMVIRFEADDRICRLHLKNGQTIILPLSLDIIEGQLGNSSFIRIHPDHLVNVEHITRIPDKAGEGIRLSDGNSIPADAKSLIQLKKIIEKHINQLNNIL